MFCPLGYLDLLRIIQQWRARFSDCKLYRDSEYGVCAATDKWLALYDLIFKNDKIAITLNAKERLEYHFIHSLQLMLRILELALTELLLERRLPSENITKAFAYVLRHFENLRALCKIEQAPLHTHEVERALKKSILHRKNSLFVQTTTRAAVGDLMVRVCMTAHLKSISPVWYLTTILCNAHKVKSDPEQWLPWNIAGAS
jgi:transposase